MGVWVWDCRSEPIGRPHVRARLDIAVSTGFGLVRTKSPGSLVRGGWRPARPIHARSIPVAKPCIDYTLSVWGLKSLLERLGKRTGRGCLSLVRNRAHGVPEAGLQADQECIKGFTIVERIAASGRGRQRGRFDRRHQGKARRLRNSLTQHSTIPRPRRCG